MEHVFVWTLNDVLGLTVLGVFLVGGGLLGVAALIEGWLKARAKRKAKGGG